MKPLFVVFSVMIFSSSLSFAQTDEAEKVLRTHQTDSTSGWKTGGILGLNITQTSLTNWAAGGQNSIAGNAFVSLFANYKNPKSSWDNSLDLGYGLQKQGKKSGTIKTDDKIDFTSKYGRLAKGKWFYAALLNFKTQMTEGYNFPNDSVIISDILAPAYLLAAAGMDYKPSQVFTLFISPITGKFTLVNDQMLANAGAYGVSAATYADDGTMLSAGEKIRSEIGGYLRAGLKADIMSNVNLSTKMDMFSNYLENPQNIDIGWETLISMKVNKFISASLSTHLIYDDDIKIVIDRNEDGVPEAEGPRIQFKEVLGVGFSFKF
jgi:hypothetical protein